MELVAKLEKRNGKYVVSSRIVAEQLGKRHSDVLESLEQINQNGDFRSDIILSNYKAGTGKSYKEYLLTKDGFTLYMFNIQGYLDFKMAYINKFNEMENIIKNDGKQLNLPQKKINTFKNIPVMEVEQLANILGINIGAVHNVTLSLGYKPLSGVELRQYKLENKTPHRTCSRLILLYKEMVIDSCKRLGFYNDFKDAIENYFKTDNKIEAKNNTTKKKSSYFEEEFQEIQNRLFKMKRELLFEKMRIEKKLVELEGITPKMTAYATKDKMYVAYDM